MYTNTNDEFEYKKYRLEVKSRLAAPLNRKRSTKFGKKPEPVEETPREIIIQELASAYNELEKEYLKTIERIKLEI